MHLKQKEKRNERGKFFSKIIGWREVRVEGIGGGYMNKGNMNNKPFSLTQPPKGYFNWLEDLKIKIHKKHFLIQNTFNL